MTKLNKPVSRITAKLIGKRPVVLTIAPAGGQSEALIGVRLLGKRTQYVLALSNVYRWAAQQYGLKEYAAKRAARKLGIPWRKAKRKFNAENSIP